MTRRGGVLAVVAWLAFAVTAALHGPGEAADPGSVGHRHMAQTKPAAPAPKAAPSAPKVAKKSPAAEYTPTVRFRLRTELADGKMAFVGVGGSIEGIVNPPLRVAEGDVVQVTLINNDGVEHDVVFPDFGAGTDKVNRKGASSVTVFRADKSGEFAYFCSLPGHRPAGMEGKLTVGTGKGPVVGAAAVGEHRARPDRPAGTAGGRPAAHLPGRARGRGARRPAGERDDLQLLDLQQQGAGAVPARAGGGHGRADLQEPEGQPDDPLGRLPRDDRARRAARWRPRRLPGETKTLRFKALNPGLYVYHCATPMVANHITSGMYGLILVEPPGGLPKVDREYYVMQGELYTDRPFGQRGHDEFSVEKLLAERAEYFVFNGAVGALTTEHPMKARVGETVRIFFGVGGPNATSSFHVIGEIFDRVYKEAAVGSPPATNVQTTMVPAGGAAIVEFKLDVPGRYILVDHSLSRLERGLAGFLVVEGDANPAVFHSDGPASMLGH